MTLAIKLFLQKKNASPAHFQCMIIIKAPVSEPDTFFLAND